MKFGKKLLFNDYLIYFSLHMLYFKHVESLFLRAARHVVQGLTLAQHHFKDIAFLNLRQFQLGFHKGHGTVVPCNIK